MLTTDHRRKNSKQPESRNTLPYPQEYQTWLERTSRGRKADPEATSALLGRLKPAIDAAVRSYGGGDKRYATKARLLALDAVKKYDPSKGVRLDTYVHSSLRSLNREVRQRKDLIHVPENVYLINRARALAEDELRSADGSPPSLESIADKTGIPVKRLKAAERYRGARPTNTTMSLEGDSMSNASERDPYAVWTDFVYHDLDDKDKVIMKHVTGYQGAELKPKGEIAKQLGISAPALSQRINKIADKLQQVPQDV